MHESPNDDTIFEVLTKKIKYMSDDVSTKFNTSALKLVDCVQEEL
jgi:hypothetical protein